MTNPAIPAELIGTWTLVSYVASGSGGEERYPHGRMPQGQLIYTAEGDMAVMLMRRGRPKFAADDLVGGSADELRSAFEGFEAYTGTFDVDSVAGCVRHHLDVCRFPNWEGGTQLRHFKLSGERLELSTPPITARGREWIYTLLWQRKKYGV
ncbi:MAG: lipocalin-like domain-containing protein [Rhodocyclaceae bacterium]|nr:lipocalin-like domain-containing protein [Rhodocyclaceae bacterium]